MGLDVGERRIGIAVSDALGILATPLTTVLRESDRASVTAIGQLAATHGAARLVVGLPFTEAGEVSSQAARIQAFAQKLRAIPQTRVVFWDERHTTVDAAERLEEATRRGGRLGRAGQSRWAREAARRRLDAAAAAVMLQAYLDQHRAGETADPVPEPAPHPQETKRHPSQCELSSSS